MKKIIGSYSREEYEKIFEDILYPQPVSINEFWWDDMILGGE